LTLIEAASHVHKERPDIEFRLFGSAPAGNEAYYEQCLQLRQELGLEKAVIFAGYRANAASAFNEGDIAVLSSVSEAFPFVILEAMLCERPVVATGVGGVPEQLRDCGVVVEPRNPRALAEGILRLMGDEELRKTYGKDARKKALQEYSVRQSGMAHETVYRRLATLQSQVPQLVENGNASTSNGQNGHTFQLSSEEGRHAQESVHKSIVLAANSTALRHGQDGSDGASTSYRLTFLAPISLTMTPRRWRKDPRKAQTANTTAVSPTPASVETQADWRVGKASAIALLADDCAKRCHEPIDALEITALLESGGVTDEMAKQYFDAPDAFALGDAVLEQMRAKGLLGRPLMRASAPVVSWMEMARDYLRGLLALVPPLMLLIILATIGAFGQWTAIQLVLMSLGMTGSMLVSNGFVQAISRRTSIYIGVRKPEMAARFVRQSTAVSAGSIVAIALLTIFIAARFSPVPQNDLLIFLYSFVGTALVWLTAGSLPLIQRGAWLSIALIAGWLAGIATNLAIAPFFQAHLAIAIGVGFVLCMTVIIVALYLGFTRQLGAVRGQKSRMRLPSLAYMVTEAIPYWAYGSVYMVFIFVPHVIGWMGQVPGLQTQASAFTTLELALTLSLLPMLLASGVGDHTLRLFWRQGVFSLAETPGETPALFGNSLLKFANRQRRIYILALCILTVAVYLSSDFLLNAKVSDTWFQNANKSQFAFIFGGGLIAYALLGIGIFNSVFSVTLGRPHNPFISLVVALVFMVLVGYPLSMINFEYSVIGFICACFFFAVLSDILTEWLLKSAEYCFASVI
jgi:hypothetical protein